MHGSNARLEKKGQNPPNIGYWTNAKDTVTWEATVEKAGAFAVVLEVVPADLAARVTASLSIPTIGIGAGNATDAQVLVWQDLLGLNPRAPRFVRPYADLRGVMTDAVRSWASDVVGGRFPDEEHSFR